MRTTAVRQGDRYVINGYKRSSRTPRALTSCNSWPPPIRRKARAAALTVFLVDNGHARRLHCRQTVHMMGDVTYEIALDNVEVPVENRIGNEGATA